MPIHQDRDSALLRIRLFGLLSTALKLRNEDLPASAEFLAEGTDEIRDTMCNAYRHGPKMQLKQ